MNKPSNRPNEGSCHWNEVWELILFLLGHILIWCVAIVSLELWTPNAHAGEEIDLSEVTHGSLLFNADINGRYTPAPSYGNTSKPKSATGSKGFALPLLRKAPPSSARAWRSASASSIDRSKSATN